MPIPLDGCSPSASADHAAWVIDALRDRQGVGFVVPDRLPRIARVHHVLDGARWHEVAPEYLGRSTDRAPYPFPDRVASAEGDLGDALVDRLVVHLAALDGGDHGPCHFGLWSGWGDMHPGSSSVAYGRTGSGPWNRMRWAIAVRRAERARREMDSVAHSFVAACPVAPWWGGRDMRLFDGPLAAARRIGSASLASDGGICRRSPQWWWPSDRTWFVANEIDHPWSYVAGPGSLVDSVLADDAIEAVEVTAHDPL